MIKSHFTQIYVAHTIFTKDLLYSCGHFVVKTDGKSSLNGGF